MENLNNVPSSGTFGNSINEVNHNFGLVKVAIDGLEGRTIRSKGLFPTVAALNAAYPSPIVGDYAYVGSGLPAEIYACVTAGTWHDTGQTGGSETINLCDYSTTTQMNAAIDSGLQGQVGYAVCSTAGATKRKDVVVSGFKLLANGGALHIKMTTANTNASATMNISPTSTIVSANTKPLFYNGEQATASNTWKANEVLSIYYDGTNYQATNAKGGGGNAEGITYDNTNKEIDAANVQAALDELLQNGFNLERELAYPLINIVKRLLSVETSKMGLDEELVIAKALTAFNGGDGGSESALSGNVTIANSDCIMIIGSSFGAGYTMEGKHWTDIVSMFSDYCFQNVSLSGTSSLDRMNSLLAGTIVPRQNAKYAFVVNSENTSVNQKYLLKEIDNLCKVCLSFGMEPIIGTSYRNYLGNYQENMYVSSLYRDYCKKHNYIFMDAAEQYQLLMKGRYDFNRGGSHIGEREIPVVAYAYMDALHGMERPVKSIKVFMPRESVVDIDNLVFNDTIGRAKRFKEYLMNNYTDSNLTFPLGYALISVIIPSEQKNTKIIELEMNPSTDVTVYARKTNQRPWPTKANLCTRFHIEDEISVPSVNDTYTYNGTTFTVKHVNTQAEDGSYGTFCDIYCTPNLSSGTTTGGTLVRASGSGEASIDFSSYNVDTTYTPDSDLIDAFNGGHWVEIEPNDKGIYSIVNLLGIMDIDRIDFLVKANNGNSFNINGGSIKVNWSASELKTNYRRLPVEKFHCHYVSGGQELLPEPTFGAEGTTQSTWKDGQGNYLVSEANYEKSVKGKSGVYPMDATSIIKVSNSVSMNYTIPASSLPDYGQVEVEVVARNFGTSINSVTVNSWDFNELKLGFGGVTNSGRTYSEMSEQVGLFWKICHFTIDIMYYTGVSSKRQLPIKIYAEKAGMEIARVSVKVKNNN